MSERKYCPICQEVVTMDYMYDEPDPKHGNFKNLKCPQCDFVSIYQEEHSYWQYHKYHQSGKWKEKSK